MLATACLGGGGGADGFQPPTVLCAARGNSLARPAAAGDASASGCLSVYPTGRAKLGDWAPSWKRVIQGVSEL